MFKLYQQFPGLLSMAFPDETAGEYIDKHAAQIGMVRTPGQKAVVLIVFTGVDGTYIPAGTVLYAPEIRAAVRHRGGCEHLRRGCAGEGRRRGDWRGLQPAGRLYHRHVRQHRRCGRGDKSGSGCRRRGRRERRGLLRPVPRPADPAHHLRQQESLHHMGHGGWATEVTGVAYASCIPLWNGNTM